MNKETIEYFASQVVDAGYRIHKEMGPGLLESVYQQCFLKEMKFRNISVQQEVLVPLFYLGEPCNKDFRLDLLVENEIIIEIKSVDILLPVHKSQLITYLKLTNKLGFIINFKVPLFKDGIHRMVNKYY